MSGSGVVTVYDNGAITEAKKSTFSVKVGLAQMLRGGVIMDVVNAEQARIAEEAGACAVMALERVPADIRAQGGVARMSDPGLIKEIKQAVTIPVMAKARIVFKSGDPALRARAIVQAVTHYSDPEILADVSCGLGEAMVGINLNDKNVESPELLSYIVTSDLHSPLFLSVVLLSSSFAFNFYPSSLASRQLFASNQQTFVLSDDHRCTNLFVATGEEVSYSLH
ncbi:Pyridoxal 5'-phosphate synthase subunit PdxS [Thalictrum thalictroides]|uniref:pyridoxal 5'-phosphate synthase (glutamine hydrolyzing) n=1 Tax=Thalictrum thalictroides TaxID=46969 RepID=A0A7J6W6T7_THATH|nr:Pyridoxal 5'-phosphate synthase subunit PdxS [Thalictrum thalictroides]